MELLAKRLIPNDCQTRQIPYSCYYWCLAVHPHQCVHASRFGNSFFCDHPDRSAFVRKAGDS